VTSWTGAAASGPAPTGLRRFVKRPAGAAAPAAAGVPAAPSVRADLDVDAVRADAERCEMCRQVLEDRHGHLVDTEKRSLTCACRACYLLFTHEGAGGGRYRAVPERVYYDPSRPLTETDWNELQIPVAMAFFFYNSALGRVVAGYPSPGGATECELDLAAWDRLAAGYPLLAALAPDVEAILVTRQAGQGGMSPPSPPGLPSPPGPPRTSPGHYDAFLIPIDECYSLVGELRLRWQGFDGGAEAHAALAAFLDSLRRRALVLEGS
jgi:Family of unknown function (DUF5947)